MTRRNISPTIAVAVLSLLWLTLQSCFFTGVESTPRITHNDVKRNDALPSPELLLSQNLHPDQISHWGKGHPLLVTDQRINILLPGGQKLSKGDTILYEKLTPTLTVTSDTATILSFTTTHHTPITIRLDQSPSAINAATASSIPFTIDLPLVDRADSIFSGNTYYTLSNLWVSEDGTSLRGKKYIPVNILKVIPGNADHPLHIIFSTTHDNTHSGMMMTAGNELTSTRNFHRLFSFTDPHLRYPQITPEMWQLIINGQLAEGMTRDEARLSIGSPSDVKKNNDGASIYERWTYPNGSYLIFIDGLLSSFRI